MSSHADRLSFSLPEQTRKSMFSYAQQLAQVVKGLTSLPDLSEPPIAANGRPSTSGASANEAEDGQS